ncbi:hypothetical protein [Nocardioides daeguensis]|uniref:hypothetical protein n=1 Tax=Nocardioides daeguensis TaxID=908359 RepID=UPI001C45AD7B|nr:hypothetical protein [Nocardioides daeguensis]MBV6728551.1 hypothetical protein [Nocardioides daeguensis]MCR1773975.1 hypothetical protein [Nocardioides daeguensis]
MPDDLDSLVQAAMDGTNVGPGEDPVESVLYTIRSDDSHSAEPQIVVEAEVVRDSAFEGLPSVQVRFVGNAEGVNALAGERPRLPGSGPTLGYRPAWTPVLVRTPADLAEQMRVRWREAVAELQQGVDPRMETFLAGVAGMESALAVLRSSQSSASKFVLLQGLMDPDGVLQFEGLGLDAGTFAEQIRKASEGDEDALIWLADVQREEVLTSLAEVTGIDLAAEADFRLSRWHQQAMALIEGVTMSADDADFEFSMIRSLLTMRADTQARREELRAKIAENQASSSHEAVESAFSSILNRLDSDDSSDSSGGYGILEDWFFEETRNYLEIRFRQSLPGQFATALVSRSADSDGHAALVAEVRRMAREASVNPIDYAEQVEPAAGRGLLSGLYGRSSGSDRGADRTKRIVQAVRYVVAEVDAVRDDDLGTLVVAQEVLAYAKWKRDELRAAKQMQEADRRKAAAVERAKEAQRRSDAALQRKEEERTIRDAAGGVERVVQQYAEALSRTPRSIAIQDPLPESSQSAASARVERATAREAAAVDWLAAAKEREAWAVEEAAVAATPAVSARLDAEREAAVSEQTDATAEVHAARDEQRDAEAVLTLIAEARSKFEDLIGPVRDENRGRAEVEFQRQQQERARQEEERRHRAEEFRNKQAAERERQDAANRRQEELNQRQQERAAVAKDALARELEHLLGLPSTASVWRRKSLAATREALEETISRLQAEIVGPLVPPRTRSKVWPNMLGKSERYLGTVKKLTDYGAFVSLPAGTDGLLRAPGASLSVTVGQRVIVEITDLPYGKPIVLKLVSG